MILNVANADRAARIFIALLIGILYVANVIAGTVAIVLGVVAIIFVATGFLGFCPIYRSINFSTRKQKKGS